VSADSIVPGAGNPQALNRYSYVFNNPLKYIDPSGHCSGDPNGADKDCWDKLIRIQDEFKITLEGDWQIPEMDDFLLPSLTDIKNKVGNEGFFKTWAGTKARRYADNSGANCGGVSYACAGDKIVHLYQGVFKIGQRAFKETFIHEFGHLWDQKENSKLSQDMATFTGSRPTQCVLWIFSCESPKPWNVSPGTTHCEGKICSYAGDNAGEDFAVAFSKWVLDRPLQITDLEYTPEQYAKRKEFIDAHVKVLPY
jgi:hypothetical protein